MIRRRLLRLLSPTLVLLAALAFLLLPRASLLDGAGIDRAIPFGATPALADTSAPSQGGPQPSQEPDTPHP